MATHKDRDIIYTSDGVKRTVYVRESNATAWYFGLTVALALLAIALIVFWANTQSSTKNTEPKDATTQTRQA